MGYDLHVFRGTDRSAAEPIRLEVWADVVAANPDLRMTGSVEATSPSGEIVRIDHEGLAEWTGHSSGIPIAVDFRRGRLVVKNPDDETITWLVALADRLGARVQGDDGEFYPPQDRAAPERQRRAWFRGQARPKH
jgi:hypothetical protein